MARLRVVRPGLQTTVQDLGRYGFAHFGISASGAADPVSFRLGNRLAGNPEGSPALEMTLVGGEFEFEEPAVVAAAGADFAATMDRSPFPPWTSVQVEKGQTLCFSACRRGARGYLCIRGGLRIPPVLGSASTHLFSAMGGYQGRALKKGDLLEYAPVRTGAPPQPARPPESMIFGGNPVRLRVTAGPQLDFFPPEARALFSASLYQVSEEFSRMGLRLGGPAVTARERSEMVTEGVSLGAVQIAGNGRPILLFVEHQTTGGYPKIANVISADLHRIGQLRPGDQVRFEFATLEDAWSLLQEQEALLRSLGQEDA